MSNQAKSRLSYRAKSRPSYRAKSRPCHIERSQDCHIERSRDRHIKRSRDCHIERSRDSFSLAFDSAQGDISGITNFFEPLICQIERSRDRHIKRKPVPNYRNRKLVFLNSFQNLLQSRLTLYAVKPTFTM